MLLISLFYRVYAADPIAYEGSVVLRSGEVMAGRIYIPSFELVFVITDDQRLALPIHRISQIRIYDHQLNVNRKFFVQASKESGFVPPVLFEIILWGDINVYRKPKQQFVNFSALDHLDFDYYFEGGDQFEKLEKFSKRLYPIILQERGASIIDFIRANDLSPNDEVGAIQIIRHYNQSKRSNQMIADLRL